MEACLGHGLMLEAFAGKRFIFEIGEELIIIRLTSYLKKLGYRENTVYVVTRQAEGSVHFNVVTSMPFLRLKKQSNGKRMVPILAKFFMSAGHHPIDRSSELCAGTD